MKLIILYFDPGLGAMLIQGLVAAVAAFVLFSKNIIFKIKSFFGFVKKDDEIFDDIEIKEGASDNESN